MAPYPASVEEGTELFRVNSGPERDRLRGGRAGQGMNDDWQECGVTIGRMNTILEDLRKYGFSLVIGLLAASGLVGGTANNRPVLPLASLIIMVLVVALFGVDLYYQVLLSGTVERALDLESASATSHLRITKIVSDYVGAAYAVSAIFALYIALLVTAFGMGMFGSDKVAPRVWTCSHDR